MNFRKFLKFLVVSAILSLTSIPFTNAQEACIDVSGTWKFDYVTSPWCWAADQNQIWYIMDGFFAFNTIYWLGFTEDVNVHQDGCNVTFQQVPSQGPVYTGTVTGNVVNLSGPFVDVTGYSELYVFSTNSSTVRGKVTIKASLFGDSPYDHVTYKRMRLNINGNATGIFNGPDGTQIPVPTPFSYSISNAVCYLAKEGSDPKVEIRVDANRDSDVSFDDPNDKTSNLNPYLFWINNNSDSARGKYGKDLSQYGTGPQDFNKKVPSHYRDLEDFVQLRIRTNADATNLILNNGYYLSLEMDGISIKLFQVNNKGQDYIINAVEAQAVLDSITKSGAVKLNKFIPTSITPDKKDTAVDTPFIFEGKTVGYGTLRIVLKEPNGTAVISDQVDIQLVDVKDMYEYARATANGQVVDENSTQFPAPYSDAYRNNPNISVYFDFYPKSYPPSSDEEKSVIIFVHGCCVDDNYWQMESNAAFKRLWWSGYRGLFASFRWPTIAGYPPTTFNRQEFNAWKFGPALRDYINSRAQHDWAGYKLYLLAHSQGNIVATEALNQGLKVNRYVLTQAAVPADCFDRNPLLLNQVLVELAELQPTPYEGSGGYAGYCSHISVLDSGPFNKGSITNFFNPVDGALWSWDFNNSLKKPDKDIRIDLSYMYDSINNKPYLWDLMLGIKYIVEDPYESMAFVSRSRTEPTGREGRTRGPITRALNLHRTFNFTSSISDHAAQFERAIQNTYGYYNALLRAFGLKQ